MSRKNKILAVVIMCFALVLGNISVINAENSLYYDASKYGCIENSEREKIFHLSFSQEDTRIKYVTIYSDVNVAGYIDNGKTIVCTSDDGSKYDYYGHTVELESNGNIKEYGGAVYDSSYTLVGGLDINILFSDFYVFSSKADCDNYLKNGLVNNPLNEPQIFRQYNSDDIYFDNFQMNVHDSNIIDEFYIEFYYEPSEYMMENIDKAYVDIYYDYDMDFDMVAGLIDIGQIVNVNTRCITLPLKNYQNSYKWNINGYDFLNDTAPLWYCDLFERFILGDELYIDFNVISLGEIGGNTLAEITKSRLDITIIPYIDNTYGKASNGKVDFLNPDNSSIYTSTPNSNGEYISNNDYKVNDGYYYTEVGQDTHGNNTYNYYYITDNSKTEIDGSEDGGSSGSGVNVEQNNNVSIPSNINVNINQGNGDNVTINDDDYSADALNQLIDGGAGIFDNLDTEKNDDGFLSMLTNFFAGIDDDLAGALGFGMGSTILICVLRSIFRR